MTENNNFIFVCHECGNKITNPINFAIITLSELTGAENCEKCRKGIQLTVNCEQCNKVWDYDYTFTSILDEWSIEQ